MSFCVISFKITWVITDFLKFYIYLCKIEIRNSEIYLPEVSVSSIMGDSVVTVVVMEMFLLVQHMANLNLIWK